MPLTSRIPDICDNAERDVKLAVEATGFRIVAGAQGRLYKGHGVDTGFMRGEIHWLAGPGDYEGQAVAGANYSGYVEYGTVHPPRIYRSSTVGPLVVHHVSRGYTIAAMPFMTPAAEDERERFARDVAKAYGG